MKLGKIIKFIDSFTTLRIYQNTGSDWEITYEGSVSDMPWRFMNCHLIKSKDNEDSEAICPYKDGNNESCLRITLRD